MDIDIESANDKPVLQRVPNELLQICGKRKKKKNGLINKR
tara:strand:+ start:832 stop:951 length:120 start_codon:yes stop_codon:yes gene_type:complete